MDNRHDWKHQKDALNPIGNEVCNNKLEHFWEQNTKSGSRAKWHSESVFTAHYQLISTVTFDLNSIRTRVEFQWKNAQTQWFVPLFCYEKNVKSSSSVDVARNDRDSAMQELVCGTEMATWLIDKVINLLFVVLYGMVVRVNYFVSVGKIFDSIVN